MRCDGEDGNDEDEDEDADNDSVVVGGGDFGCVVLILI